MNEAEEMIEIMDFIIGEKGGGSMLCGNMNEEIACSAGYDYPSSV